MTTNANPWRLFRRSTAAALVFLLVLFGLSPVAEAGMWVRRDWSKVQAVVPGTQITVLLYEDEAPPEKRKINGFFHSATSAAIKLRLSPGPLRAVEKHAVRRILVPRPLLKRYHGWIAVGALSAVVTPQIAKGDDIGGAGGKLLLYGLFVGVPSLVTFLVAPKMGGIYNVPPDQRDPSNTKSVPAKDHSTPPGPAPPEPAKGKTGSGAEVNFLREEASPQLLKWQARQAVLRKGLDPPSLKGLDKAFYGVTRVSGAGSNHRTELQRQVEGSTLESFKVGFSRHSP